MSLAAVPVPGSAVYVDLGIGLNTAYDSNVFNEDDGDGDGVSKKHDVANSLDPSIAFRQPFQRGESVLRYTGNYQRYHLNRDVRSREIDTNHFGAWNLDYALGRRTRLQLADNLESTLNHDFRFERDTSGATGLDEDVQGRNTLNEASAAIEHQLTRRLGVDLSGYHQLFVSEDPDQIDSQAFGSTWSGSYQISGDHRIGISGGVSAQFFERLKDPVVPGVVRAGSSRTLVYQGQGTWRWQVFPETVFSAAVGPAFIHTHRNSFNLTPISLRTPSEGESRWTVFAAASIEQRLTDNTRGRLGYSRSTSPASGTGGSSVRDSVNGSFHWQISERLLSSLVGSWVMRTSATDLDRNRNQNDIDSTRWTVAARGAYQLTRHLSGNVEVGYSNQDNSGTTTGSSRTFDRIDARIGIRYDFDRISLFE
jgi:hypothetical protein